MSIVMGDFNHDEKKKKCKLPLFNFMEQQGIVSSVIASNISVPTWRLNQNESQIDDI